MKEEMTSLPAAEQVSQLQEQLLQAFLKKAEAEKAVKEYETLIQGLRNNLGGVSLGQQLEKEQADKK